MLPHQAEARVVRFCDEDDSTGHEGVFLFFVFIVLVVLVLVVLVLVVVDNCYGNDSAEDDDVEASYELRCCYRLRPFVNALIQHTTPKLPGAIQERFTPLRGRVHGGCLSVGHVPVQTHVQHHAHPETR